MTGSQVLATLLGLVCLAFAWLVWSGRVRWPGMNLLSPNWAWTAVPALGFLFLAYGLAGVLGDGVNYVAFPIVIAGCLLLVWQPDWLGPRWWRERDRTDLGQHARGNAWMLAAVKPSLGELGSLRQAESMMAPERPALKLRANLVTERHGRPSAGQRPGVVEGWLLFYERALVFAASNVEDKMRERPVVERLAAADMRSVVRVPRGTQENGERRVRDVATATAGRLRLDTAHGSWLLETWRPGRLVRELEARYGTRTSGTRVAAG